MTRSRLATARRSRQRGEAAVRAANRSWSRANLPRGGRRSPPPGDQRLLRPRPQPTRAGSTHPCRAPLIALNTSRSIRHRPCSPAPPAEVAAGHHQHAQGHGQLLDRAVSSAARRRPGHGSPRPRCRRARRPAAGRSRSPERVQVTSGWWQFDQARHVLRSRGNSRIRLGSSDSSGRVKRLQYKATPDGEDDAMPNTDHRTPAQNGRWRRQTGPCKYIDAITPEHRPLPTACRRPADTGRHRGPLPDPTYRSAAAATCRCVEARRRAAGSKAATRFHLPAPGTEDRQGTIRCGPKTPESIRRRRFATWRAPPAGLRRPAAVSSNSGVPAAIDGLVSSTSSLRSSPVRAS
jgi:hypothetical protein